MFDLDLTTVKGLLIAIAFIVISNLSVVTIFVLAGRTKWAKYPQNALPTKCPCSWLCPEPGSKKEQTCHCDCHATIDMEK